MDTQTVALEFEGLSPSEILLNGIRFIPRPYRPGPQDAQKSVSDFITQARGNPSSTTQTTFLTAKQ
ncbi:hypothetical protein DAPPUDRAFT_253141 [Daphnia pulex]|uniref:Uncharacterized protein n=1 Tax=Daphnia pulex TaxID=6669 RepID=E9H488_DAPPU|nr:hypothetical protein DAPPUDRAFT_253141 [Daphnia pulex]|eukprot:EFX73471.1 hypothetical protein DAPPUDRAFT_253141 [Daphnia pulex]